MGAVSMADGPIAVPRPGKFFILTWDGGGNVHPTIGLGRRLAARGHSVRVMGQRTLQKRIEAAGCSFRPLPAVLEWDAHQGRRWEDEARAGYRKLLFHGTLLAEAFLEETARNPPDVSIVDAFLNSGLSAAEYAGLPTAALLHARYSYRTELKDPVMWKQQLDLVNEFRRRLMLQPIPWKDQHPSFDLWQRCDRVLVVLPREFENYAGPIPPNVHYVGPLLEGDEEGLVWDLPWPPGHPDPLVVVALSTTYMSHEAVMNRIVAALHALPVHVLVTLGGGLEPHELSAPSGVIVRRYVPHALVLPHAALVVTHGGMGTVMAAFTYGVPMVCLPLGRDQNGNAMQVEILGAGRSMAPGASVEELRATFVSLLHSDVLHAGARRMAEVVASYGREAAAVAELEDLLFGARAASHPSAAPKGKVGDLRT